MRFPNSAGIYVIEGWFSDPFLQKLQESLSPKFHISIWKTMDSFFFLSIRTIDSLNH